MRWVCNCPLCRLLVHPVIRRLESVGSASLGSDVNTQQQPELEVVEDLTPKQQILETKVLEIPQQPQTEDVTQVKQLEGVVEVKIPQEVIERFEQLEEEIGRLRKELSVLSESMKAVMVEVKEAITEISNPFNVLRGKPSNGRDGNGSRRDGRKVSPSTFLDLLKVVYRMLDDVGKEQALLVIKGYLDLGVIDDDVGNALIKLVDLADVMKSKGLTIEKQLPHIYALLKTLSINDPALDEYLLKELLRREKLG